MPPDVRTRSVTTAALNADVNILTAAQGSLEVVPAKAMFETVIAALVLVRNEMVDDDALVELVQCCARACLVLKTVTEGEDVDNLSEPVQKAIESLEKTIHYIQSKVDKHVSSANLLRERGSGSTAVSSFLWKAELQKTLEVLNRRMEVEDDLVSGAQTPANAPFRESDTCNLLTSTEPPDSGEQTLQRLVSGDIPQGELVSSIEAIFSSIKAIDTVSHLRRSDAQVFVNAVDETLDKPDFPLHIRTKCVKSLYGVCSSHSLLPRSLQIELGDSLTGAPRRGGFGDVWKCEYRGKQVAVKVLKVYVDSDLQKVARRFCREFTMWRSLRHPNMLPLLGVMMSGDRFSMVSEWMPNGDINQFVKVHADVNRHELLEGVAKGLIYMHEQRMAHGDLKGANILIDGNGHARLADFGLLAIIPDTASVISSGSFTQAGTHRWMSPELLDPEKFGLKRSRPTENSDCYALGMVVYEVLSGNVPFYRYGNYAVVARVLEGEHPQRPLGARGAWLNDDIWSVLERCWKPTPSDRPKITDVLLCLEKVPKSWSLQMTSVDWSAEDSADESELSSPSHGVSPGSLSELPSTRKPSLALGAVRAYNGQKVDIGAQESQDPAVPQGIVDKAFSGDGEAGGQLRLPSEHLYKSYVNQWASNQTPTIKFFFLIN